MINKKKEERNNKNKKNEKATNETLDNMSFGATSPKLSFRAEVLKELKHHGYWSTFDGIQHMVLAERFYIKIVWAVMFVAFMGLSCLMITNSIIGYLGFSKNNIVRKQARQNITFPALSICDWNNFATREASEYLRERLYEKNGVNVTNYDDVYTNKSLYWSVRWKFYETFSPDFNDSLRRSFGYSLDDLLIKCEFDSRPCNRSWFDWFYHTLFGNCYKFNSGNLNGGDFIIVSQLIEITF